LPGERNPQSTAEEFAPPQGESVLDASMMAELIETKKEIVPQLKESAGTSRARPKCPRSERSTIAVGGKTWGRASDSSTLWFMGSGRYWRRGSLPQFGRQLKRRSGWSRRRGYTGQSRLFARSGGREAPADRSRRTRYGSPEGTVQPWGRDAKLAPGASCGF